MLQINSNQDNTNIVKGATQPDIVRRLEELNKWQEEQKKLLVDRQNRQRQMLGLEQRNMYQMLGLLNEDEDLSEGEVTEVEEEEEIGGAGAGAGETEEGSVPDNRDNGQGHVKERDKEVGAKSSYTVVESAYATTEETVELRSEKPKRKCSFLRRGEGLKQRFKIDPDQLRLNNLPRYKYANAHPRLRMRPRTAAKPKQGVEIKPKATTTKSPPPPPTLDDQEKRFQQLLISSKNVYNSTPDTKFPFASKKNSRECPSSGAALPKVRFAELPNVLHRPPEDCPPCEASSPLPPVTWSKVLDPQEIYPIQPRRTGVKEHELEEDIFELLEQQANNGSIDMNSSQIKRFMQNKAQDKLNDTDETLVNMKVTERLRPIAGDVIQEESSGADEEDEEEAYDETQETLDPTIPSSDHATDMRVHFSESHDIPEYVEETLETSSTIRIGDGNDSARTGIDLFEQFKQALFAALQGKAERALTEITSQSDTTLTPQESIVSSVCSAPPGDLQQQANMIKMRLADLEKEIAVFKENNIQLMKAKQEHELEKARHAQEHLEAMERLNDEKIQLEMYLHDERMKLEDEKRKFEQQMRMRTSATIAKERKEIERLQEQLNALEVQMKNKESAHASAQARLRSQLRNVEKDQRRLHEEIESLTKENKRLECENLKINRACNNKLLQEINRNIAKLAPKVTTVNEVMGDVPVLPSTKPLTKVGTGSMNKSATKTYMQVQRKSPKVTRTTSTVKSIMKNSFNDADRAEVHFHESQKSPEDEMELNLLLDQDDNDDIMMELKSTKEMQKKVTSPSRRREEKSTETETSAAYTTSTNLKREIVNADGSKDIWYPNGNLKKISEDGMLIRMLYYNKDIKETNINEGTVKYYYAESNTWHTTYLDGLEILEFPNGQIEHRYKNGVVEIHYPNNSVKIINPADEHKLEEWRFVDGTNLVQMRNGDKILSLPNGQKEIHTKLNKRREYPDGTVKLVYPDGSQETRYSNGRIRLKDKNGKLIMDTENVE